MRVTTLNLQCGFRDKTGYSLKVPLQNLNGRRDMSSCKTLEVEEI